MEHGITKFTDHFFKDEQGKNYLLKRFFHKLTEDQIELEIKTMIEQWIQKGRPKPILNIHVIDKLFGNTPVHLTIATMKFKS